MPRESRARGAVLLAVLIVIVVLAGVAFAALELASLSRQNAVREAHKLSQTSCVEAARQAILGRLRVFGLDPTSIELNKAIATDSGTRTLRTGHLGGPEVRTIAAIPPQLVGGAGARNRDLSNLIVPSPQLGGRY